MPNWTDEQKAAINARNSNIIVSAAAGSGKTAVLTERVMSLITDTNTPVNIDNLLIVTFTNAAASEMKTRIVNKLTERLTDNPNDSNIQLQLSLIPNAKICTIDSFCINLVRDNFFELDIQQDFDLLDNAKSKLIQQNAVDCVMEKYYEGNAEAFFNLVELFSRAKDDKDFTNTIKNIYNYINAQPFPFEWLDGVCEMYNPKIDINDTFLKEYAYSQVRKSVEYAERLINNSLSSLDVSDELCIKYEGWIKSHKLIFDKIKDLLDRPWDEMYTYIHSLSSPWGRIPVKRGYISPSKTIVSSNKDQYKKVLEKNIMPFFVCNSAEYTQDCEYLYDSIRLMTSIVRDYHDEMIRQKRDINSYTFSDIMHYAINLLFYIDENGEYKRTALANELKNIYYEILVDEYQDTNSAQDNLFRMLSNGHNRFMVGDVKQSIYRFRHAMPNIFNEKRESYTPYCEKSESKNQRIILDRNFRSRKGICEFTNFLFSKIMTKDVGELDYDKSEYLNYGADYADSDTPCVTLDLINTPTNENADEYEARQCAQLIKSKIAAREKIRVGNSYREINFGDFAVLFRTTTNKLNTYSKVFQEYNIPVISNNTVNLFDNNEISILVSLIQVIDNPVQDIPLLATLMSVFYGYSADEIAYARVKYKSGNLYSSISRDKEHFERFINDIDRYRKYASSMSVEAFLRQLIAETSYMSIISAMGSYNQRRQNISTFLSLAHSFDKGENVGLTAFMRYIDSINSAGLSVDSAGISSGNSNCVTLTTIHKSKGLEFPVVILAGASHKYNTTELTDQIQLNAVHGIGLKVHNKENLYRYNSLQYNCIKDINKSAAMSENLRVLYVAVTRAKEQFIMLYSDKNIENKINKLSSSIIDGTIYPKTIRDAYCDGDLILMTALMHKDANALRDYCDEYIKTDPYASFGINIILSNYSTSDSDVSYERAPVDNKLLKALNDKLSFRYERNELSSFASKRNASALDKKEQGFKYFAKTKPAFMQSGEITPAQKGTAMHAFMQYCDYQNAKDDINNEIERLKLNGFITSEQADCLDIEKLSNLFNSPLAERMLKSDNIYREIKVSSYIPVNELEHTEYNDKVLIQGIADCVFEENGKLVLVDYKTDRVNNEAELLSMYEKQIGFYKIAVSKALGKPVKTALLYSFFMDKECIYK